MPKTFAQIAVEAGLLSRADVSRARELADERGVPQVVIAVRELGVDEVALVAAFRRELRILAVDPGAVRPDVDALRELSRDLCRRLRVVPLQVRGGPGRDDKELWLAMADPTDTDAIAEVERATGAVVDVALLPLSAIDELTERGYKELHTQVVRRTVTRPFGVRGVVSTQPHARPASGTPGDEPESTATMPFRELAAQADHDLRLDALIDLLVDRGIIKREDYEDALRERMKPRGEPTSD